MSKDHVKPLASDSLASVEHAYFVIPVYNEEANVQRVLDDLAIFETEALKVARRTSLVFVDDGSTDGTVGRLRAAVRDNLQVLTHPTNLGPGAAFQSAFRYLLDHGLEPDDLVITLEGDSTSDPSVFPRLMKRLAEGDDIVLASPYLYGGGFTEVRKDRLVISHVGTALVKLFLGIRGLATFSCFFRIYRGRGLRAIDAAYPSIVSSKGFECAAEVLMKGVRIGMPISEVPFRVDWTRRQGKSKMRVLRTSFGYFRLFLKFSRRRPSQTSDQKSTVQSRPQVERDTRVLPRLRTRLLRGVRSVF
jgi:dolichol-phosphate mannosyltransferase